MPLLVTASTGRISAGVIRHLQAAGEDVRVPVRDADKATRTFEDQDDNEIVAGAFDTSPEIAGLLSGILGHGVTYVPMSPDDRRTALLRDGSSEWFAELLLSLETSAEAGQIGTVTTTLKELLGHEPRTVENFLIENAARFRS